VAGGPIEEMVMMDFPRVRIDEQRSLFREKQGILITL
jgi:hypothetical protein